MLAELGTPLYRIRQRLTVGDYKELAAHAEALYPRYARRKSMTAYMVAQALMWARMADGRREEALEPFLRCYELLRAAKFADVPLPGRRRLKVDRKSGISPELLPVWFDGRAAKRVMPAVLQSIGRMQKPLPPGARIYYASLAAAAGETATAAKLIKQLESADAVIIQLREITLAELEIADNQPGAVVQRVAIGLTEYAPLTRPLADYCVGRAKLLSADDRTRREGIVQLLRLPALYGTEHPELAAAGLFVSMQSLVKLGDNKGSISLRRELLDRYGQTFYASKVRSALSPNQDP